jgi:hypothetical protein
LLSNFRLAADISRIPKSGNVITNGAQRTSLHFDTSIERMSLPLVYRGFNYVSYYNGAYENADSLGALSQTGANSASLNLDYGIDVNNSIVYADANYTDGLAALGNTISAANARGLSVMVKPLIDFLDPAKIGPNDVGDYAFSRR